MYIESLSASEKDLTWKNPSPPLLMGAVILSLAMILESLIKLLQISWKVVAHSVVMGRIDA